MQRRDVAGIHDLPVAVRPPHRETFPLAGSVQDRFTRIAAENPDAVALMDDDRRLSYRDLAAWSDRLAARLQALGAGRGDLIGLALPRSPEAIAAILAVLKLGAAYVPFDLSYPRNLLRYIYEDSRPRLVLTGADQAIEPFWDGEAIRLEADDLSAAEPFAGPETRPDDLAYVMYTSGSTGRPKGVMIPHRGITRLVVDADFARLDSGETLLQLAPLSFDASTFEIWGALLNGGRLAILSAPHPSLDEIAGAIARHGVTTLWLTSGLFNLMVDHQLEGLRPLRQLIAGGDVLSPPHVLKVLRGLPGCRMINGYGPTENTTFTCCYTIPPDWDGAGSIPVGKPIAGTDIHILDEALTPVPDGEEGELHAGGDGVALGYLNRPELTAEKFVADPLSASPRLLYRTGDRVWRRGDGMVEFVGRADRQIKISGKRVELDEIEACLKQFPAIADAAVISLKLGAAQPKLAGFVTAKPGAILDLAALRRFLRAELPEHMVPARIERLAALPLSPTGKLDRAALASLPLEQTAAVRPTQNHSGLEAKLLAIWRAVLGSEEIGVDDNFFDLGGTSLLLIEAHAAINSMMEGKVGVVDLFAHPSIVTLTAWLESRAKPAQPLSQISARDRARQRNAALGHARSAGARPR